jgi:hypothetical protein
MKYRLSGLSVINQFDGLLVKFCDGCAGKDAKPNGTGMTTGAVLLLSFRC